MNVPSVNGFWIGTSAVVENRAVSFFHAVQLRGQIGILLDVEARDAPVGI